MKPRAWLAFLERCAVVVLGLYLTGVAINVMTRGDVIYFNRLRSPVAAPIALAIGITLLVVGFRLHRERQ